MRLNLCPGGSTDPGWHHRSPRHSCVELATDSGHYAIGSGEILFQFYFEGSEH